jgi:lysozyme
VRTINERGLRLIESFETLQLTPYDDGYGFRTVGWGHKMLPLDPYRTLTIEEADELLYLDLRVAEEGVENCVTYPVNDNQFAALVSLAFNCGVRAIARSTLVRMINARDPLAAANQFLIWNKVGNVESRGLTRRRQAERALFLLPPET